MFITLKDRSDRLGANITNYISQIIYAYHNKYFIVYNRNMRYNNSIFVMILFDIIDDYNNSIDKNIDIEMKLPDDDYFRTISYALHDIKCDYFTFFKNYIFSDYFYKKLLDYSQFKNYKIPFDVSKTILVHLRLEDCRYSNDYDGRICSNYFRREIDNDKIVNNNTNDNLRKLYKCNYQSPLSKEKLQTQIDIVTKKYPDHKVIIITNPGEQKDYSYDYIQNDDENLDLFLLSQSNIIILSRSTFPLSSLFYGKHKEVYIPLWGHIPLFGTYTKYDKSNFNYY